MSAPVPRTGALSLQEKAEMTALRTGLLASLAFASLAACGAHEEPAPLDHQVTEPSADYDVFGVKNIYPSREEGNHWVSSWEDKSYSFVRDDPLDTWFDTDHGTAEYEVQDGTLYITGPTSRMYIHDPELERQWGDVEITVYAKRLQDEGVQYSGITAVARTNHLVADAIKSDPCDSRGYGGRFRFDGTTDFEKETSHPKNAAVSERPLFDGPMPRNEWIGYKFIVYDVNDDVHLELWADFTDGEDGGDWTKVNEFVDSGDDFGVVPCDPSIDPLAQLTNDPSREGSESGKPNVSVYFRADGIKQDGMLYKSASVREITPPS